ncbi:MAG: Hg(II)-responsive transcriptional regulator [Pseudomonadota bacterium]|nr:Hg(II)-responsive transcriptional regulator [Nevskiales bacterium]MEC9364743.1 Hg(II)-responsive transcriptional regulator [Pseudomonadota bacterium]
MHETYTIGTLAQHAGVHLETIRYYQRRGLVGEPQRPLGGIRRYTESHVRRLRFIRHAQEIGFSLDEVGELLKLEDGAQCREARTLGERRLADVRNKLMDLQRIESALAALVDRCASVKGRVRCPLIASLQEAS